MQFGSVLVHWSTTDANATPQLIAQVGAIAQHVLATYVAAGYRAPKSDGTTGGGTDLLDIYVSAIGPYLYGTCSPSSPPPAAGPYDASAYCTFNSDYSWAHGSVLENLEVTAAHELFHAVQFAYDSREDPWFMEATATWAEDEVYTDVNDNRQYLPVSPLHQPTQSLDQYGASLRQYGDWIFFRYLSERFPQKTGELPEIVRRIWERADSSRGARHDLYSIQAIGKELASRGTSLSRVFAKFADGNRRPAQTYREGSAYPPAPLGRSIGLSSKKRDTSWKEAKLNHLASTTVRVKPGAGLSSKAWALRIRLNLPDVSRRTTAVITSYAQNGRITTQMARLNKRGDGRTTVRFGRAKIRYVEVTLVNAGTRYKCWQGAVRGVEYACSGISRDNRLPMKYRFQVIR